MKGGLSDNCEPVSVCRCQRELTLTLAGTFTLRRRGVEARLVLGDTSAGVDGTFLKNVARGWTWFEEIKAGMTMQAIVDGRQPATLSAGSLIKSQHRMIWADQRA